MDKLLLTFVNVGYGEAMLIKAGSDDEESFTALVDGGGADMSEFKDSVSGRIPIWKYLDDASVDKIDLMICTHIHEDHISGLLMAAKKNPPKELWQTLPPDTYKKLRIIDASIAKNISQHKFITALNDYISLCELTEKRGGVIRCLKAKSVLKINRKLLVNVLAPSEGDRKLLEEHLLELYEENNSDVFLDKLSNLDARMNNFSLMLRLDFGEARILLPGDTNRTGYGGLDKKEIKSHIFKIGHHGQIDGADEELIKTIAPSKVVCCASSDRRYDSAHPDIIDMVKGYGAQLYFSDCPKLPGLEIPVHNVLEFEISDTSEISARYDMIQ